MEYRTDYTDSQVWFDDINASIKLNYIVDRGEGVSVTDNGVFKITASGSLDFLGVVVTIGTEQFYTIGTEGDYVKLLSMYNLYLGGSYDTSTKIWTPYGEEATGMQDSTMLGWRPNLTIREGTTVFSSDEKKGTNYNDYQGSIVEEYVNNYKRILESKYGVDIVEARLITYEELTDPTTFACNGSEDAPSCPNSSYPWLKTTAYWTGSPNGTTGNLVWYIAPSAFGRQSYYKNDKTGVRPVIVIPKSLVN